MTPYALKAVFFDFDGTLTLPGALDFSIIRRQLGCPDDTPVLEFIHAIRPAADRTAALQALNRFERDGAARSRPNAGAEDLIARLRSKGLKLALISRNSRESVECALKNFRALDAADFDLIVTRDDPVSPKPSPAGILHAAAALDIPPGQVLVVGDFSFDMQAGRAAGALTAFLDTGADPGGPAVESDFTIARLEELHPIVAAGIPLPAGKLPNDLLKSFLDGLEIADAAVIIRPGIGEDTAALDVAGEEVIVLKSDPITFATDSIGYYAVLINANDIATSGAVPRWLLTTLLLPCGITPSQIQRIMRDLQAMCRRCNITLCGGHTEITDAVTRPVVSGMLVGTIPRQALIDKRDMRPGDRILLTKAVAVEGTAIIAREFGDRLKKRGMRAAEIDTCRDFLNRISILPEARIAARTPGTSAMHDVTEGGLASALRELGIAGGHRLAVRMDQIPVYPETDRVSRLLGIDPLGLIGSGSLLICCRGTACDELVAEVTAAGIQITCIGEVLEAGQGITATRKGRPASWPDFKVDEITRLFH